MAHSLDEAVDMLDRLVHEHVVSGAQLVSGTIALAMHAAIAGPGVFAETAALLADLEALILGEIVGFEQDKMDRVARVAAALKTVSASPLQQNPLH